MDPLIDTVWFRHLADTAGSGGCRRPACRLDRGSPAGQKKRYQLAGLSLDPCNGTVIFRPLSSLPLQPFRTGASGGGGSHPSARRRTRHAAGQPPKRGSPGESRHDAGGSPNKIRHNSVHRGPRYRLHSNGLAVDHWSVTDRRVKCGPSAQKSFLHFCSHGFPPYIAL